MLDKLRLITDPYWQPESAEMCSSIRMMKSLRKELPELHLFSHYNFQPNSNKEEFRYTRLAPLHSWRTGVIMNALQRAFGTNHSH